MSITPTLKLGSPAAQLFNVQSVVALGSSLATGAPITTKSPAIVHVTAADATVGVVLPKAVPGKVYIVKNSDAANAVLKVYPADTSTQINAVTAGSALSMAAKTSAVFACISSTLWITVSLLPS